VARRRTASAASSQPLPIKATTDPSPKTSISRQREMMLIDCMWEDEVLTLGRP